MPKELFIRLQRAKSAEKVQKLLKKLPNHNIQNDNGDTLLHAYIRRKDKHKIDCLLTLLVYGNCHVDASNEQGFTPLHIAAELNDVYAAKALLAFHCEVNSLNPDNYTPLDIAQKAGNDDIIDLLISVGGQTGEVVGKSLYALKTWFEKSVVTDWKPEGKMDNSSTLSSDELKRRLETIDDTDHEAHHQSKVHFNDTPDYLCTPDQSVTKGMTLESISIAQSKFKKLTPSPDPPPTKIITNGDAQSDHRESHDEPDGPVDDKQPTDVVSKHRSCDHEATPLVKDDEEEEDEGLLEPFSHTPLELQSIRTLKLIEEGSITADGYTAWQEHRKRKQASPYPLGSIRNMQRARSLQRGDMRSWQGEEEQAGMEDGTTEQARKERGKVGGKEGRKEGGDQVGETVVSGLEDGMVEKDKKEETRAEEEDDDETVPEAFRVKPGDHMLCLDGGGIRGLVQLEILRIIEEFTHRRIVDLFEWIVGTSTGGILALGLVYANMTCTELHQLYFKMKERVFKNPKFGLVCNTKELETILLERFGREMRMNEVHKPKVLVCAVNKETTALKPTFFNNCLNDEFSNELVWKVGRYTSAAPIYFTECDNYVDGGLLANNPCSDALTKIQDYQMKNGGTLSLVVSVGCGQYPPVPLGNTDLPLSIISNPIKALDSLRNLRHLFIRVLMGNAEGISENCRCRCGEKKPSIMYFRFNPDLPEAIESTETDGKKLCDLVVNAKQLLEINAIKLDLLVQHFHYMEALKRKKCMPTQ